MTAKLCLFQAQSGCRKTSCLFKNGVAGAEPPTGTRGGSPSNIAPARMPGVYAQRFCTMQSQPSIHSLSRGKGVFGKDAEIRTHQALHEAKLSECPKGDRDRGFALSYKNRLFLQAGPLLMSGLFLSPIIIYRITAV